MDEIQSRARIIIVFMDGDTRNFTAEGEAEIDDGILIWRDAVVENRTVESYCVPIVNIREVFEYL